MTKAPEDLFVMDWKELRDDLYRMGSSDSPKFSQDRAFKDLDFMDQAGVKIAVANGNGFSAFTRVTAKMKAGGKNVWKIKKGSALPEGVILAKDLADPTHFMFAPATNMPLEKFLRLLEQLATNPFASVKLTPQEIRNAH